jgi:diphthamide biosynthesis enzyme Dph1/Dph2-like protein
VVLQVPKEMLVFAFELSAALRKECSESQYFVLYDSLKQSCCTDVLGAEHVGYDGLVHFGKACFS